MDSQPGHKQLVRGPCRLEWPVRGLRGHLSREATLWQLRVGDEVEAALRVRRGLQATTELRFQGRRYRLASGPNSASAGSMANWLKTVFPFGERTLVWRAGAGVVARIRDEPPERQCVRGAVALGDNQDIQVTLVPSEPGRVEYDFELISAGGPLFRFSTQEARTGSVNLDVRSPVRLDGLAMGLHVVDWLLERVPGGGSGGGGAGGGGGGGGDGGGGC